MIFDDDGSIFFFGEFLSIFRFVLLFFLYFLLPRFFLERLWLSYWRIFWVIWDGRYIIWFFLWEFSQFRSIGLFGLLWSLLTLERSSLPQLQNLFFDDHSICIILSSYSFLLPFFKTGNLLRNTLQSIDLIFDIFRQIILLLLDSLFLFGFKLLYSIQSGSIDLETVLWVHMFVLDWW